MRIAIMSFFVLLFFQACSLTTNNPPQVINVSKSKETKAYTKPVKRDKKEFKRGYENPDKYKNPDKIVVSTKTYKPVKNGIDFNGIVKGIVKRVYFSNGEWSYEIKGVDTSNGKLPYAKANSQKKMANIGDYIYAIIRNSQIQELYFIKKANLKRRTLQRKKIKKIKKRVIKLETTHRRDKTRKAPIALPQEEHISFD
jgi:hypothetical protein